MGNFTKLICGILVLFSTWTSAQVINPNWKYIRPTNTGIGGDYIQTIEVDRFGNKWSGGYMPFWSEGSVTRFNDTVWTNWSNFEGYLPADRVYDVAFDNNDGLWVATNGVGNGIDHGGISHYDGSAWITYNMLNTSMPGDDFRGICVDHNNNVWATYYSTGNGTGGVCKFDGTTWTIYNSSNSVLPQGFLDKIDVDAQNNIYVGTDIGLAKFNGSSWSILTMQNSGLTGNQVKDVEFDDITNKLYVVTGLAVDVFDGTNWSHFNSSNTPISATGLWAVDAHGDSLIVTTIGGTYMTYVFDGTTWFTHNEMDHTYDARIDHDGNFWICGIGFIEKFDGSNWTTYTRYNTGLTTYFTGQIFIDSKNQKWFASSENGGINRFDCPLWEDYGPWNSGLWPSPPTLAPSGSSITEDIYGNIWMSYYTGVIVKVPGGDMQNYPAWTTWQYATLPNLTCRLVSADSAGNVWTDGGCGVAAQYDSVTNGWITHNLYAMGLPCGSNNYMYSINTDPYTGKVWFCTQAGIAIYDAGNWTIWSSSNGMLPFQNDYYDVAFDSQGNAWIASDNGLIKHNGTSWVIYNESNSGLLANHVQSITIDSNDVMYMAAFNVTTAPYYGGLNIFDGANWQSFAFGSSPMPHYQLEWLELDKLGNLWINSSTMGTIVYNANGIQGFECLDYSLQTGGPTGVSDANPVTSAEISAWPNPFQYETVVELFMDKNYEGTVSLYDVTGSLVWEEKNYKLTAGSNSIIIDGNKLNSGMYIFKLTRPGFNHTVKIFKK
jgi:hypothetical protein